MVLSCPLCQRISGTLATVEGFSDPFKMLCFFSLSNTISNSFFAVLSCSRRGLSIITKNIRSSSISSSNLSSSITGSNFSSSSSTASNICNHSDHQYQMKILKHLTPHCLLLPRKQGKNTIHHGPMLQPITGTPFEIRWTPWGHSKYYATDTYQNNIMHVILMRGGGGVLCHGTYRTLTQEFLRIERHLTANLGSTELWLRIECPRCG